MYFLFTFYPLLGLSRALWEFPSWFDWFTSVEKLWIHSRPARDWLPASVSTGYILLIRAPAVLSSTDSPSHSHMERTTLPSLTKVQRVPPRDRDATSDDKAAAIALAGKTASR